jgi:K+-sensing histidine kinase KdpD
MKGERMQSSRLVLSLALILVLGGGGNLAAQDEKPSGTISIQSQTTQAAQPIFAKARAILQEANIPEQAIETQIYTPIPGQDLATAIIDVAHDTACGTVVVGRSSFSWLRELLQRHVADKLSQEEHAFKLWVVEDDTSALD